MGQCAAGECQRAPAGRHQQRRPVTVDQGVLTDPVRYRFKLPQKRLGGGRRAVEAVQAVGQTAIEGLPGTLSQGVQFSYHSVGKRVAHSEHSGHAFSLLTVLAPRRLVIDQSLRRLKGALRGHHVSSVPGSFASSSHHGCRVGYTVRALGNWRRFTDPNSLGTYSDCMTHRHSVAMHGVGCAGARTSGVISEARSWPLRPSSSRLTNKECAHTHSRSTGTSTTAVVDPEDGRSRRPRPCCPSPARRPPLHASTNCRISGASCSRTDTAARTITLSASPGSVPDVPESGRGPARSDSVSHRVPPEDVEWRTTSSIGPSICRLSGSPPLNRSASAFIAASPRSNKGIFTAVS